MLTRIDYRCRLTPDFLENILRVSREHAVNIANTERNWGSLGENGLSYKVLSTSRVRECLPELMNWYLSELLLDDVKEYLGPSTWRPVDEEYALNVNVISGVGAQYERHVDRANYVLVLFCNSLRALDGGDLEVEVRPGVFEYVRPTAGMAVLLAGNDMPHRVMPMRKPKVQRVSVVAQFLTGSLPAQDPALDRYLFG